MVRFDECYSTNDKDYLKGAINFYLDNSGLSEYDGKLYITFTEKMPDNCSQVDKSSVDGIMTSRGLCRMNINNTYFVYVLADQSHQEHIKTLFHEMCHVLQYASGKQTLDNSGRIIWNKSIPYPATMKNISFSDYEKLPWEVEAREHEEIFYYKWELAENAITKKKVWYNKVLDRMFDCVVYLASMIFKDKK